MASYRKKKKKLRQGLTMAQMAEEKRQILTRAAPKTETKHPKEKNKGVRELYNCSIRAAEGEGRERTFILSFSSEEPYTRWFGQEILDHSEGCVDLERLNSIGGVLFNHERDEVVGKIDRAWIEDGRGYAEITFDSDDSSEKIYQKVKTGTLKGVSVGYMVEDWEEVMPNKQSQDGRFTGPCSIAKKWAPYEVSIVSVPADPTVGVGRSLDNGGVDEFYETYVRQLQYNQNLTKGGNHHE